MDKDFRDFGDAVLAHVRHENGVPIPHHLLDHLQAVGALAAGFAQTFGAPDWGGLAGLWHDLGKLHPDFQRYIRAVTAPEAENAHVEDWQAGKSLRRVDHSTAGALHACDRFGVHGRVLAYLIAGHHCGLGNWIGELDARLANPRKRELLDTAKAQPLPLGLLDRPKPTTQVPGGREPGGLALWVRLLFSCLVDADFLDTEAFLQPHKTVAREGWSPLEDLRPRLKVHMARFRPDTSVNLVRAEVLSQCRAAAAWEPGVFTLTVPTGGGKTLASMAFALEHARRHGKRRVIHVIPYTSIIEQSAEVFRGIFGEELIEHHSNAEVDLQHEDSRSRLACENWDAPLVVTTTVQLFESLFAVRTSRCRKLHNIVDSIIVLDEAQLLPVKLLQPILDVLNLLTKHYGVSVVIATATQPALASRQWFGGRMRGLEGAREIVADPRSLYARLQRVQYAWPADFHARRDWEDLAAELSTHAAVLAIVNRRADARELYRRLPSPGRLHLSALMCGEHRARAIRQIRERLAARRAGSSEPVRVVSTQLVEAGVDVDFPLVYRALAGLDSIAQAAGRCNREGRLAAPGRVVVFVPPKPSPRGLLRHAEEITVSLLHGRAPDALEPQHFADFFERLYRDNDLDAKGVGEMLRPGDKLELRLRDAADAFRLIDNDESGYQSIYVRYRPDGDDAIDMLLSTLKRDGPERWLMRRLQRYAVSLPPWHFRELQERGDLEELRPQLFALRSGLYDAELGVPLEERPTDPGSLIG